MHGGDAFNLSAWEAVAGGSLSWMPPWYIDLVPVQQGLPSLSRKTNQPNKVNDYLLEILFEAKDVSADNLIDNIKWANFVKKKKNSSGILENGVSFKQ